MQPALTQTVEKLRTYRQLYGPAYSVPDAKVKALSDALAASGKTISDIDRQICNQYVVGDWLLNFLSGEGRPSEAAPTEVPASHCGLARVVFKVPSAQYPRLDANARLIQANADGSYLRVSDTFLDAVFDATLPRIEHSQTFDRNKGRSVYSVKVQISAATQLPAAMMRFLIVPRSGLPFGVSVPTSAFRSPPENATVAANFEGPQLDEYAVYAEIGPAASNRWNDAYIGNDVAGCMVSSSEGLGTIRTGGDSVPWSASCELQSVRRPNPPTNVSVQ